MDVSMDIREIGLWKILFALLYMCFVACRAEDSTVRPRASGSDVVRAVIGRIEDSNIFPSDNRFLRRIAYVESKDGTHESTYRSGYYGGIWQVDMVGFRDTQDTTSHPGLVSKFDKIQESFDIDWRQVQWDDLLKPLYSGLAARLFLSNIAAEIPRASDIKAQGEYWKTYYNTDAGDGTIDKFVDDVEALLKKEACSTNSDIFFVLDSSGSIGASNFVEVRDFVANFVDNLKIGPNDNQIGVITFSGTARVSFYLNSYSNQTGLLTAIQNIIYSSGATNTADGLCKLIREGYTTQNGARLSSASVSRLAIVMTDGMSNRLSYDCSFDTLEAAAAVHSFEPSIIVFAIGVTDNINFQELSAVATKPDYVSTIDSFNSRDLEDVQQQQTYDLCYRASVSAKIRNGLKGFLDMGESIRYQYQLPTEGMTIVVCVTTGNVVIYASTKTTTPNSAFYEHKLDVSGDSSGYEVCDDVYISQSEGRKQNVSETFSITLYVSLYGLDESNRFLLNSTFGDTSKECDKDGDLRLINPEDPENETAGYVQYCYEGKWQHICDDRWEEGRNAEVVCKLLRLPFEDSTVTCKSAHGNLPNVSYVLDDVRCMGNETELTQCFHAGLGLHNCDSTEIAGVICKGPEVCKKEGDIRFFGNVSTSKGVVEICRNLKWGLVCDDNWDNRDAKVVCKQLGFNPTEHGVQALTCAGKDLNIENDTIIWLDEVNCQGNETHLADDCTYSTSHNCIPAEAAGVNCDSEGPCEDGDARLVRGSTQEEGSVEVCFGREWKAVCDDFWANDAAKVVCRQLGLPYKDADATDSSKFNKDEDVDFGLDDVICNGDENNLLECVHSRTNNCRATERAGAICKGPCSDGDVQLVRGSKSNGSVEICINGRWGSVCDDGWNTNAASVVCRQLEYPAEGAMATERSHFGAVTPAFYWFKRVNCSGNENSLFDCKYERHDQNNETCHYSERAGVICSDPPVDVGSGSDHLSIYPHRPYHPVDDEYAAEAVANINGAGINGTIHFIPDEEGALNVVVKLRGLTAPDLYHWDIHNNSVTGSNCDTAGPLYDPNDVISTACNYEKECNMLSHEFCAVGALTVRFGALNASGMLNKVDYTGQLKLQDIIGRSIVIQDNGGAKRVCGNIYPIYECEESAVNITRKAFDAHVGPIQVCIHNVWHNVIDDNWTDDDATVACRDLRLPHEDAVAVYFNSDEGLTTKHNTMDDYECKGGEAHMMDCPKHDAISKKLCNKNIAGVICQTYM